MKAALAAGAYVRETDRYGWTALHWSASRGTAEVAGVLLGNGAYVEAADVVGWRPLHCAAWSGNGRTVEHLLSYGADVNARAVGEWLPRHGYERWGYTWEVITNIQGKEYSEPYAPRCLTPLTLAAARGSRAMVELLLRKGADPNAVGDPGPLQADRGPLHAAAEIGAGDVVEVLLAAGADVNTEDRRLQTPLRLAVRGGHEDIGALLRRHGAKD